MEIIACITIGYLLGCFSPSAILARLRGVSLRDNGTNNMGATNATMVLGRKSGVIVLVLDMAKAILAYKLCDWAFPKIEIAGLLAGLFCVIGHVFPVTMRFRGGKGLASFAGVVLARNPSAFMLLLLVSIIVMLLANYSFVVPFCGAIGFCTIETLLRGQLSVFITTFLLGSTIIYKHFPNAIRAIKGEDVTVRQFIKTYLLRR